jgi:membrane protein YqaA with SNARE-associated domain
MDEIEKSDIQEVRVGEPKTIGDKIKLWFNKHADSRASHIALMVIAFTDGFISPLPPDPFLALMVVLKPARWLYFTLLTLTLSVAGGVFGYFIGYALFESVGEHLMNLYNINQSLQQLGEVFNDRAFLAIFIAALTPIPYQIFTVAGGVFKINLITFIVASIIGRAIRYFALSALMVFVGHKFGKLIFKYLNWLLLIGGVVVLGYIVLKKF